MMGENIRFKRSYSSSYESFPTIPKIKPYFADVTEKSSNVFCPYSLVHNFFCIRYSEILKEFLENV